MKALVLDASVALAWFLKEGSDYAEKVIDFNVAGELVAPPLLTLECMNIFALQVRAKRITKEDAAERIVDFQNLCIAFDDFSEEEAWVEIYPLALKHQLTSYDATYLALAKRRRLPLATLDAALRTAAKKEKVALFA